MTGKIVYVDDWEGLYVGDKLISEGHSLRVSDVLSHFGIGIDYVEADEDWLLERGSLPKSFKKVKVKK